MSFLFFIFFTIAPFNMNIDSDYSVYTTLYTMTMCKAYRANSVSIKANKRKQRLHQTLYSLKGYITE